MDRRRHEVVAQRVHREQRRESGGITEVVVEPTFGQRRTRRGLRGNEAHAVIGNERQRQPSEIRTTATTPDHHVGLGFTGERELFFGFEADDRLVQQHVVEHRAERIVRVVSTGGVSHRVADRETERAGVVVIVDR